MRCDFENDKGINCDYRLKMSIDSRQMVEEEVESRASNLNRDGIVPTTENDLVESEGLRKPARESRLTQEQVPVPEERPAQEAFL